MEISFSEIFAKSQDLSSYEGRTLRDENGESMYPDVHLTEQDGPIVRVFVAHGMQQVASELRTAVAEAVQTSDGGVRITLLKDRTLNMSGLTDKAFAELFASYVMHEWLRDKDVSRSDAYKLIFDNLLTAIRSTIWRKRPTL